MKNRSTSTGKRLLKAAITTLLACSILFLGFYAETHRTFDNIVAHNYVRKSWKFPGRVYSDWTELCPGQRMPPDRLRKTLEAYLFSETRNSPGELEFYLGDGSCKLVIPEFLYPDGPVYSGTVEIDFNKRWEITDIRDSSQATLSCLRIPPILLGRVTDPDLILSDYAAFEEIPHNIVDAIVASEDHSFWSHHGFTAEGIIRATKQNIAEGKIAQGGSSITQQLMKNLVLTPERSYKRKFFELLWALSAEFFFDKETILELYLNQIYLGQSGAFSVVGIKEAARFYFDKPLNSLSLSECALLAGIIPAPARFNPFANPRMVKRRRDNVLRDMANYGFITPEQRDSTIAQAVLLKMGERSRAIHKDYLELARREVAGEFGNDALSSRGVTVFTNLDPYLQAAAYESIDSGAASMDSATGNYPVQAAIAAVRVRDGAVVALVGGRSDIETEFNRALDAHRQPGSAFKIFVYATAAASPFRTDGGLVFSPSSILPDTPSVYFVKDTIWKPRNYVDEFAGQITVRRALERSQNVATVNLALGLGLENIIALAESCGIESPLEPEPSLALGAFEVTPFEMAVACLPLPRAGLRPTHSAVKLIIDHNGKPIYRHPKSEVRVLPPEAAYIATHMLRGVVNYGRGFDVRALGFIRPSAGKTGTTNDEHDSWFVGFTPEYSAAVWAGMDDNTRLGLTGTHGALPIWTHFALLAHEGMPYSDFEKPDSGLVFLWIDERNGMLAAPGCPVQIEEAYIKGTEQTMVCTIDHSADSMAPNSTSP